MPGKGEFRYLAVSSRDLRREAYITSIGRLSYAPGDAYPGEGHPSDFAFQWRRGRVLSDFAIVLVETGEGELHVRNAAPQQWKAGQILLIPPGVWHRYRPLGAVGWTERWICLSGDYLFRLRDKGWFPSRAVLRYPPRPNAFEEAWSRMWELGGANSLQLAARGLEALAVALEWAAEPTDAAQEPLALDDLTKTALDFIQNNCHRPIGVEAVAAHCKVSRRTLERRFTAHWTRSIAAEIEVSRLSRAKQLLAETTLSIKEVGYMAGFGGPNRLIRTFRQHFGSTPGAFRNGQGRLGRNPASSSPAGKTESPGASLLASLTTAVV